MNSNFETKRTLGAPIHSLSKSYDVPLDFVTPPPPHLRQCITLFAVAEGLMLIDIG